MDDPLNPLYGTEDAAWNPEWKYTFTVKADKKEWIIEAEIPFASLGLSAPSAGVRWKANFGRERYAGLTAQSGEPELYLWSPNDLSAAFAEPLCFGAVYFERGPISAK